MIRYVNDYTKTLRLHAGLSQEQLAFLLGCDGASKVSRYESGLRKPSLTSAFAYEAIFGQASKEVFIGPYTLVERQVNRRAQVLLDEANHQFVLSAGARRLLHQLASKQTSSCQNQWINTHQKALF